LVFSQKRNNERMAYTAQSLLIFLLYMTKFVSTFHK
jgi:hypothetical protein